MRLLLAVLAAGASRRLGTSKQLLRIKGEPVLRRQCRVAIASDIGPVAVVVGCDAEECAKVIVDLPIEIHINDEWSEGMASSLRLAVTIARQHESDGLLVLPCDQYRIIPSDLRTLHEAWRQAGGAPCISRYHDQTGPPVIIPSDRYSSVERLRGDIGARSVLFDPRRVPPVEIGNPRSGFDLDLVSDLRAVQPAIGP